MSGAFLVAAVDVGALVSLAVWGAGLVVGLRLWKWRVARRLSPAAVEQWQALSLFGETRLRRQLLRGQAVDDERRAPLAAEYAAVLRENLKRTASLFAGFGAIFVALAVWAATASEVGLALVLAGLGCLFLLPLARLPRDRRRLTAAESANRARSG